jgi:hypothetical protein
MTRGGIPFRYRLEIINFDNGAYRREDKFLLNNGEDRGINSSCCTQGGAKGGRSP